MSDHDRLVSIEVPLSDAYLLIGTLKEKCSEFHSKAHDSSDDDLKIECRKMGDDCDARAENVRAQVHSIKPEPKYWSNHGTHTDQRDSKGASCSTSGGATGGNAVIQDRAGLYVGVVALILSALALGILFMMLPLMDAKVAAGSAAAFAKAEEARTHARVALDRAEQVEIELGKKGINIPKN